MFIISAVLAVVVLVTLGYIALWTAMHENTSKGLSGFGKVMAVTLFVFSALILIFGISCRGHYYGKMGTCPMMGHMGKMSGMGDMKGMMHMPEMMGTKEEMMSRMKEWKMNSPKEWKTCVDELNKSESGKK